MTQPAWPTRGQRPWDVALKDYIDYGDANASGGSGTQGPIGPAGPQGPQGIQGPAGDPGSIGPAGPKGDPGDPGPAGSDGATGPQGAPAPPTGAYPLEEIGFIATSFPLEGNLVESGLGNWFARMIVPAGKAIHKVWLPISIVSTTTPGYNGFAVYDDDGNLLQSTPSDPAAFSTLGWQGIALNATIPAEATDRFVYVACQTSGNGQCIYTKGPNQLNGLYNGVSTTKRRTWVNNSLSGSWPATINPLTDGQLFAFIMMLALS